METFSDDLRYILLKANLTDRIRLDDVTSLRSHRSKISPEVGKNAKAALSKGDASEITMTYMRKLNKVTRRKLVQAFKLDFDMFGYDADKYF